MKLFLDTANLKDIETAWRLGVISGVTTNPSLIAAEGGDFEERIQAIAAIVDGPVNAEVTDVDAAGMISQGKHLAGLHQNVVVKVPMTLDGLHATSVLAKAGIDVNVTLIFSSNQALLAARAGAAYVSPFVGRLDDIGHDGMEIVADSVEIFAVHGISTRVLAASIRHPLHVAQAARLGAHIATMPLKVIEAMAAHPLTDIGLERFLSDWRSAQGQSS